ncbi:MBL fold metallo-hydrolase RNA specificity domain-containing protein [Nitrosomonas halophila]|uniref:Metallo-beta-lactamase family protein n=1 Tax=Nitrosomonas halophila TaxID=44576 RepID=A0A1H3LKG5_9PROT|nr:MBL fold metallo-hydrolase [Nitrosomonas halophila]SDY64873.1 metallo-beta-lactamase family protein [Nitrosomonas halophila]
MRITFLGGAGEVTGSCYLIETGQIRFLIDCGMFQGGRGADHKNRAAINFDPESIDFVLLTHAHIDHSGLLPRLSVLGFRGRVYTTHATADLLSVMLKDSAYIQEKEAEWRNKDALRKKRQLDHDNAPLYTVAQAEALLKQIHSVDYDETVTPHASLRCRFRDAGHILGSAIIEVWVKTGGQQKKLVFSGDLGQPGHPIVRDPSFIEEADYLLLESTYGNRLHRSMQGTRDELVTVIQDTLTQKRGNIIVPAFTVGRTQDLLFLLADLQREGRLGPMDIYVDSPMALAATEITLKHHNLLDQETTEILDWFNQRSRNVQVHFVQEVEDSIKLNNTRHSAIIISASGMCDAGRIKYHLKYNLPRPECSILITGFQAAGTLGRRLVDGVKKVRIFGEEIPVRASIHTIGGLSAHADQRDLMNWLKGFKHPPRKTFVVHGEPSNAEILADVIRDQLHWKVSIPQRMESEQL